MNVHITPFFIFYKRINNVLKNILNKLPYQDSILLCAMKYSLLSDGKRLRPILVYSTGKMLKANILILDYLAAAVECIHSYSLIHDDLPAMDNHNLRRGRPTCHIKYGENFAILTGDALHTLAFSILSNTLLIDINSDIRIKIISELASACGILGMCYGQELDIFLSNKKISLKQLNNIHYYKTSILIKASIKLGALVSNVVNDNILQILDDYANAIGLAFQIQDDILDVTGDKLTLGKNPGHDLLLKKNTYPKIIGLYDSKIKSKKLYEKAIRALEKLEKLSFDTTNLKKLAAFIINRDK